MKRSSPQPAPVRPRVISPQTGETLLAEDWIEPFLRRADAGALCLHGPPGSGKTTALAHLAARFPRPAVVVFLDEPDASEVQELCDHVTVVYTAREPHALGHLALAPLASWGEDERLEYLMAAHRGRCGSIMPRVRDALEREDPPENAELWRIVLDRMAEEESIWTFTEALERHLDAQFGWGQRRHARRVALGVLLGHPAMTDTLEGLMDRPGCLGWTYRPLDAYHKHLLRWRSVRLVLAAQQLACELRSTRPLRLLESWIPQDLVTQTGRHLERHPKAVRSLRRRLSGPQKALPMVASLLHASKSGWKPEGTGTLVLKGGYFSGADWSGLKATGLNLAEADLTGAEMENAQVTWLWAVRASLRGARLAYSNLQEFVAKEADLTGADLARLRAPGANFENADLTGTRLKSAFLHLAVFSSANLATASFRGADLDGARFFGARLEETDFSGANLESANLPSLDLRRGCWSGARFGKADLSHSILEGMELPGADFEGADLRGAVLTATSMPAARFQRANLREAKLGDVDWERANLTGADLRGATFHMGSSRSGLVPNAPPLEGSRTGFYTDEYYDQSYRAPEEIRKANLRGADLRGAKIDDVDFYLVDLRDAKYTPDQEAHFRRCGAILSIRV